MKDINWLKDLVSDEDAYYALHLKENKAALVELEPLFEKVYGQSQHNPYHCFDLYEHTLHSIIYIEKDNLNIEDFRTLRLAMLFHDIGKVVTEGIKKDDKVGLYYCPNRQRWQTFYDHPIKSGEITRAFLKRMNLEDERLLFFIYAHDMFMHYKDEVEYERDVQNQFRVLITKDNVLNGLRHMVIKNDFKHINMDDALLLMHCCRADAKAQSEYVYVPVIEANKQNLEKLIQVDCLENKLHKLALVENCIKELIAEGSTL